MHSRVAGSIGGIKPTAPGMKTWFLRSKGPNPKRYELRECKEEVPSETGPDWDRPGSSTDKTPAKKGVDFQGGGRVQELATVAKATPTKPRTIKITPPNKVKKPLDPRPRPRGESYPINEGVEPEMQVEYYWNRTPIAKPTPKPTPKPAPPRLCDQLASEQRKTIGLPIKKEWKPPTPPVIVPQYGPGPRSQGGQGGKGMEENIQMSTSKATPVAKMMVPLRPMPYGPKMTDQGMTPLEQVTSDRREEESMKMGCTLQLRPIWVLSGEKGAGNRQEPQPTEPMVIPKAKTPEPTEPASTIREMKQGKQKEQEELSLNTQESSTSDSSGEQSQETLKKSKKPSTNPVKDKKKGKKGPKVSKGKVMWIRIGGKRLKARIEK